MSTLEKGLARYLSTECLAAFSAAHVGIIGAGGLGSNVAMMLARSGVKQLTLADNDRVEASNLNRQAYFPDDVGQLKVAALSRHLVRLEPGIRLTTYATRVTADNAATLFAACPIVVEAVDGADDKVLLYAIFAPVKALYVTASGLAGAGLRSEGMVVRRPRRNVVAVGDFSEAVSDTNPPLAPRVLQAAAMQAGAVVAHIVSGL